ncbi:MAG: hypothetical protein K8W52_14970 [Deltaproteobacteria bacterium]|nr:hypothetical protein [Deltaproteobacteria bacterium]
MSRTLALVAALLAIPTAAVARPITTTSDPALTGALIATFDNLTPTSAISLQTTIGTPPDTVTITATTTPGTEIFYGNCPAFPDGCVFSWSAAVLGTDAPVTIVFDQPIAAIAIERGTSCYSPTAIEVTSTTGVETVTQPCGGGMTVFGGVADVGTITQVRLIGDSTWDDLRVVPGSGTAPTAADLAPTASGATVALPFAHVPFDVAIANHGPGLGHAPALYALAPPGLEVAAGGAYAQWTLPDLASGQASTTERVEYVMPSAAGFGCEALHPVTLVVSSTQDPVLTNNLVLSSIRLDPSAIVPQSCVPGAYDSDCDGQSGCWDSACVNAPACVPVWPELGPNIPLFDFWPPIALPLDDPDQDPGDSPERRDPDQNPPCEIPIGGVLRPAPPYCCTSLIVVPEAVRWRDCHALDPNAIESDVPTDSRGYGLTAASAPFAYTIHYENIGGADAHDVRVLLVLDDDLDASTLVVADGGAYDPATRTLQWIDPVVFPHDPRTVHFTVAASAGLQPGAHVRSQATVVFPDAFPPSRMDTNTLDHVVPFPTVPFEPDLAVFACEPVGADRYQVRLTNRGFGFALAAHATLVDPAPGIEIVDGDAAFANPRDLDPSTLATVTPISTTRSIDTIEVRGGGEDPCEAARWEIHWSDVTGGAHTTLVQAYADRDGDGIADYRIAAGDTGCCGAGAGGERGTLVLAALAIVMRRRRIRSR